MLTSRLTLSIKTSLKKKLSAKRTFLYYEKKREGLTIHRDSGLGRPLLPTEIVGGRLLRKISLRRKGFWFGDLGRSLSRPARPIIAIDGR